MTVRELINELLDCDMENEVYISGYDDELYKIDEIFDGDFAVLKIGDGLDDE